MLFFWFVLFFFLQLYGLNRIKKNNTFPGIKIANHFLNKNKNRRLFTFYISVIRNNFRTVHQALYKATQSFKIYNVHSHFIHIKNKTFLLHLNTWEFLVCEIQAVRTHSTLHHVLTLESIQRAAWQHSGAPVFVSTESQGSRRGGRLRQSISWFSSPPHSVRTCLISKRGQVTRSVRVHVTGVGPVLLRLVVQPQEVFVARRAAHPGLPEPHRPREEELALAGSHPTLQGHLDAAGPAPYPHASRHEDLDLLSVEAAELHGDGRVLLLLLHLLNAAPRHWKHQQEDEI